MNPGLNPALSPIDPVTGLDDLDVRRMQPYEARKDYQCPGCNNAIPAGTGHTVVIPRSAVDLRRHWHHPCWEQRDRRTTGRSMNRGQATQRGTRR